MLQGYPLPELHSLQKRIHPVNITHNCTLHSIVEPKSVLLLYKHSIFLSFRLNYISLSSVPLSDSKQTYLPTAVRPDKTEHWPAKSLEKLSFTETNMEEFNSVSFKLKSLKISRFFFFLNECCKILISLLLENYLKNRMIAVIVLANCESFCGLKSFLNRS